MVKESKIIFLDHFIWIDKFWYEYYTNINQLNLMIVITPTMLYS